MPTDPSDQPPRQNPDQTSGRAPSRAEVVAAFERLATLHELLGSNRFKVAAFQRAARVIEGLTAEPESLAGDRAALLEIDGIGAGVADKIIELVNTGTMAELDVLSEKVPSGLGDVLGIQGLGPKTVRAMWQDLGIEGTDDLKKAIDDGRLASLPRMGKKTIDNIAKALAFAETSGQRLALGQAEPIARRLREALLAVEGVRRVEIAGSIRRGRETTGDIDLLALADDPVGAHEAFRSMDGVVDVLAAGERKSSVRVEIGDGADRWGATKGDPRTVQVDLRVVPDASWGAALMYFTGSKEHNVRLRERALSRGLTLNEYGLFPDDDGDGPPQTRGIEAVAGQEEDQVYEKLGLPWIPPEIREDRGELNHTETPELVSIDHIRAELHAHTTESDGKMSLGELVEGARSRGFHTIAVTDHSKSSAVANGLSEDRLRAQIEEIRRFNESAEGITVFAGSEVDILADGSLDYDDELLAELDVVVASCHAALNQDASTATARLLRVIEHPLVHIVGHPTGRLINRREGLSPAMDEIIAAAVQHRVALEINAHWMRLDLRPAHVAAAVEAGALIAIDCDVHAPGDFDNLRYGVQTGRRGGLPPDQCVNTWDAEKLHGWLREKR